MRFGAREVEMRLVALLSLLGLSMAFTSNPTFGWTRPKRIFNVRSSGALSSAASTTDLVVVSPPGGVGEVAAVKAAELGGSVRWFVVSCAASSSSSSKKQAADIVLAQEALDKIASSGGKIELAGSDATNLLLPMNDPECSVRAVSSWCGSANAIVCTYDGSSQKIRRKAITDEEVQDTEAMWKSAIKVATKEASKLVEGCKIAILSYNDLEQVASGKDENSSGVAGLFKNFLQGNKVEVPESLPDALLGENEGIKDIITLRHGELFGTPESSPDFSALTGGPRREPELCEEYAMRTVRVDPTTSVTGNVMMGSTTRSSRHAVGEAAALMTLGKVPVRPGMDICVSSQRGFDPTTQETWNKEFARMDEMMSSSDGTPEIFSAEFGSVPDVERFADWLAFKWAPAVLRTYDIAAIRVGGRPVYATRLDDGVVEITWQELVDFQTRTTGRMLIEVTETGLVARRGPGNANEGYGSISRTPLQGEDVLVRRLAEAASQALEKGLALKPVAPVEPVVSVRAPEPEPVAPATPPPAVPSSPDVGPRTTGARRSTERTRGRRRKDQSGPSE